MRIEPILHRMVDTNLFNGKETLYLGGSLEKVFEVQGANITTQAIIDKLADTPRLLHKHVWEKGDLIIWDNIQVIHRAEGEFKGDRLLLRAQARLHLEDHAEYKKQ